MLSYRLGANANKVWCRAFYHIRPTLTSNCQELGCGYDCVANGDGNKVGKAQLLRCKISETYAGRLVGRINAEQNFLLGIDFL